MQISGGVFWSLALISLGLRSYPENFSLVYEMLFIKEHNAGLKTQTDSIRAKLFV